MVRLNHWTSDVSIEAATKMTQTYADILGKILDSSNASIEQIYGSFKTPTIGAPVKQPTETSVAQPFDPALYQTMVTETVRGVITELFKNGDLVRYTPTQGHIAEAVSSRLDQLTPANAETSVSLASTQSTKEASSGSDTDAESSKSISKTLRSLWAPLLNVDAKGVRGNDSFFVLGGDSILAMELARSARDAGLFLNVADIFGTPTFSGMVELINEATQKRNNAGQSSTTEDVSLDEPKQDSSSRFSLLKAANAEAFIQDYICPKIGVFRGGIIDVLPVTDFQALAVTGSLVKSRWWLNYVTLDGQGYLDMERMRKSASRLVQHFDILRTVFLPCGNRILQVVLQSLRPQIDVFDTEEDFETFTTRIRDNMPSSDSKIGQPYVRFAIIRNPMTQAHRILIRLSHAQYDGVCMPKIIDAFKAFYEDRKVVPSTPFSNYVREAAGAATPAHYDYWQNLLKGSKMTSIVRRDQPSYAASNQLTSILKKTIKLPPLASKNITQATMLKAAWSLTLAQLMGSSDIVFGALISGRNVPINNVESIVGPCLNYVPVRIKLDPKWKAIDLMRKVQSQQVAGMPYEALGFRDMISKCTDWPEWTYFSSTVQHQNLTQDVTADASLRLDRTKYKIGMIGSNDTLADLSVVSTPKEADMVEVTLDFVNDGVIPMALVQKALDTLCAHASSFASKPNTVLPAISANGITGLPIEPPKKPTQQEAPTNYNKRDLFEATDTLTRAWRIVLPTPKQASEITPDTSFHALGGDIISLASLTTFLEGEGYDINLDELIARPSLKEQIKLLVEKKTSKSGAVARSGDRKKEMEKEKKEEVKDKEKRGVVEERRFSAVGRRGSRILEGSRKMAKRFSIVRGRQEQKV